MLPVNLPVLSVLRGQFGVLNHQQVFGVLVLRRFREVE
jgi:hypothetical protein